MPESTEIPAAVRTRREIGLHTILLGLAVDPPEEAFSFLPGQWVLLTVAMPGGKDGQRAFSIASAPGDERIEICVEVRGEGQGEGSPSISRAVAGLEEGARVRLGGPHGKFTLGAAAFPERLVLACAGVGVAPIRSILRHLDLTGDWGAPTVLYLEGATARDILFREEFEALDAKHANFDFRPLLLSEAKGATVGRGTALLEAIQEEVREPEGIRVMLAGFNADVNAACDHIKKVRLAPELFQVERYG